MPACGLRMCARGGHCRRGRGRCAATRRAAQRCAAPVVSNTLGMPRASGGGASLLVGAHVWQATASRGVWNETVCSRRPRAARRGQQSAQAQHIPSLPSCGRRRSIWHQHERVVLRPGELAAGASHGHKPAARAGCAHRRASGLGGGATADGVRALVGAARQHMGVELPMSWFALNTLGTSRPGGAGGTLGSARGWPDRSVGVWSRGPARITQCGRGSHGGCHRRGLHT